MKEIHLTQGMKALVDDEDYERLNAYRWYALHSGGKYYAARTVNGRTVLMHSIILTDGPVDHKDRNGLNNQRQNLRPATKAQNGRNRGPQNGRKYKGVYCMPSRKKPFYAKIIVDGKFYMSSYFESEEEAALAYDELAREHHGEFAYFNFSETI